MQPWRECRTSERPRNETQPYDAKDNRSIQSLGQLRQDPEGISDLQRAQHEDRTKTDFVSPTNV